MPKRTLTETDLDLLSERFIAAQWEHCRYPFEPEEMILVIQFVKDFMYIHRDTKKIVRRWLTIFVLAAIVSSAVAGIWIKFKTSLTTGIGALK